MKKLIRLVSWKGHIYSAVIFFLSALCLTDATAAPFAYIANFESANISVIDTATNTVTTTIPADNNPYGVSVNRAGTMVYVTNYGSNSVSVIDAATNTVIATVPVGTQPLGIALNSAGTKAYVANSGSDTVSVMDTSTNSVVATVTVETYPHGVAVNSAGTKVYVANYNSGSVSVIDTSTNTVAALVTVGGNPVGVAVNPDGTRVYVAKYVSNNISVIDTATNTVVANISTCCGPHGVTVSSDGTKVYATGWATNSAFVIDAATNTVTSTVAVGSQPRGIAINPAGTRVYAANYGSNTVSVIDTSANTVIATVPVGSNPYSPGQFIMPNTGCVTLPSDMVSWWGGDNNALDMVGTNNGTLQGTATYAAGKVGQAFSFDGSEGSFVEIPNNAAFNPSGAFSVDGWFYIDPAASGNASEIATLVAKTEGSSGNGWALYFDDRAGSKSLKFVLGGVGLELQNAIPAVGWYHIAAVFDPSTSPKSKLYVNGSLSASADSGGASANSLNVRIGAMYWTDSYHQGNDRLNGKADEVEFFNRALSTNEIAAIYNAGSSGKCRSCTPPPSNMVSWWNAEDNALDIIGTNHGTLMNGATFAPGKVGRAFNINEVGQYVAVTGGIGDFGSSAFTVDFWMNSTLPNGYFILGKSHANGGLGWDIRLVNSAINVVGVNGWDVNIISDASATPNNWHHIALSSTTSNVELYIDGVLKGSCARSNISSTTNLITMGYSNNFWYSSPDKVFNGLIDEVEIFDRALTADEIAAIYNAGSAGKCLPDTTPENFTFNDVTNAALNTQYISNAVTVTGIDHETPLSITGGEYSVSTDSGSSWSAFSTTTPATVNLNDQVKVRQTSSATYSTPTDTTLTIGGVSDTFSVTTLAADTTPDSFTFADQTNVPLNSEAISNAITVTGINTASPISITGGEYSVSTDSGSTWSSFSAITPGTVNLNDQVKVRQTSSPGFSTTTDTTLTIGTVSDIFSVTTLAADTTPDSFTFTDRTGATLNSVVESDAITVTGVNTATAVSITGGEYSVSTDGGSTWSAYSTTIPATVSAGDKVRVRQTSSSSFSDMTDAVLTIGGVSDTFSVTTVAATPAISVTPSSYDFGAIEAGSTSAAREFTITNTGSADLVISSIGFSGGDPGMFSLKAAGANPCPTLTPTIAAGGSCTITVRFKPASAGAKSTTFQTISNASNSPTLDVALTGTGTIDPVFDDCPEGSFAQDFINTLFYGGITGGCGNNNFCPDNPVTRGQMAVFLLTAMGEQPESTCAGVFADVNADTVGEVFCRFIEKFSTLGITGGCGNGNFCPNDPVTRTQMAVFMTTALHQAPADTCNGTFGDADGLDVGDTFCRFIEKFATLGITGGCGGGNYCPDDPVTRAQMAVFLTEGFLQ